MRIVVLATGVVIAIVSFTFALKPILAGQAEDAGDEDSASKKLRRTPLVELIEQLAPSVVNITAVKRNPAGEANVIAGTGSILHESGLIITNHHVVNGALQNRVDLADGTAAGFRVVARLPYEDLALIQIRARSPLKPVRLGRSHDLMLGEDVLAIGNSQGLGSTVAPGIVSGPMRSGGVLSDSPVIQTNAGIHPGNSGGPLFNALGQVIGIMQKGVAGAGNITFAIPVDRLRGAFGELLSPEQRLQLLLGMQVDTMAEPPKVTHVDSDSPADEAGVRVGDVVARAGKFDVRYGPDFYMALAGCKAGEAFPLQLKRDGKDVLAALELRAFVPPRPVEPKDLVSGLRFAAYDGDFGRLPDFDKLKPVATGVCQKVSVEVYTKEAESRDRDTFALRFTGFVKIPADGLYFFYTKSDDGSRLSIGEKVVVDNAGLHEIRERGGQIRLRAGLYPIAIDYHEDAIDEHLEVSYEGPNLAKQQIPAEALFCRPQAAER